MRPPFLGLKEAHFHNRWTGEMPDPAYVTRLARACKSGDKYAEARVIWEDVTGWAFTRYMWERQLMNSGCRASRARRLAKLLDTLPPWPFEPTPSGWLKDGFPKEIF